MNKVILIGRLTKDPEIRVTTGEKQTAIGRLSLAVNRRFKKEGQPDADFFNCTCFGKAAEFAEKYLRKGNRIAVTGSIQNDNYTKQDGTQVYSVQIVADEVEFADGKGNADQAPVQQAAPVDNGGFINVPDGIVEELPFN